MQKALESGGKRRALLIAGPTASGKSALALRLAELLPSSVIINADAMQVYRDLRIVTARPTAEEEMQAPHKLYGTRDGAISSSAAVWLEDVRAALAETECAVPIFVGGTGLYFRALTEGLSPIPDVPDAVREDVRGRISRDGSAALHQELDQEMSDRLSPTDSQRVARALEVFKATGRSLATWQEQPGVGALIDPAKAECVVLTPDRNWLETRIRARAVIMLERPALDEVRLLMERGLSPDLPVMRAIGVSVLGAYLKGEMDRAQALDALTVQTRRYAKRQDTWFRGQMPSWKRLDPQAASVDELAAQILGETL
ncbi:MAG: tRNA (adenosine(37)-N6)-dimethylallyltransferase MiaA [Pseudomonadota bacterium]